MGKHKHSKAKRKKHTNPTSDSSSDSPSSSSDGMCQKKMRLDDNAIGKKRLKKMKDKSKKHHDHVKQKRRKKKKKKMAELNNTEIGPTVGPLPSSSDNEAAIEPGGGSIANHSLKPMTKEEWEKQQSIIRRVYDEDTGRYRLIKGDGEVIEEIVSKERHREINKQATQGDGHSYQAKLMHR